MSSQSAQPFRWHYPDVDDNNFQLHGSGSGSSLAVVVAVFAFLLFLSLLCLYIRCALWRISDRNGPDTGPTGPNCQIRQVGLDPGLISSLPVVLYGSRGGEEEEESMCSICLSPLAEGEKVKMLPNCRHWFHPDCIDEWLRARSSCPLCRDFFGELKRVDINGGGGGDEV